MLNKASQEEVRVRDVRILPDLNASYLPVMPDGSVLLVDNVWYVTRQAVLLLCLARTESRIWGNIGENKEKSQQADPVFLVKTSPMIFRPRKASFPEGVIVGIQLANFHRINSCTAYFLRLSLFLIFGSCLHSRLGLD